MFFVACLKPASLARRVAFSESDSQKGTLLLNLQSPGCDPGWFGSGGTAGGPPLPSSPFTGPEPSALTLSWPRSMVTGAPPIKTVVQPAGRICPLGEGMGATQLMWAVPSLI